MRQCEQYMAEWKPFGNMEMQCMYTTGVDLGINPNGIHIMTLKNLPNFLNGSELGRRRCFNIL